MQVTTPDDLGATTVRVPMPGGLEPLDPNLLSGSRNTNSDAAIGESGPSCARPWYLALFELSGGTEVESGALPVRPPSPREARAAEAPLGVQPGVPGPVEDPGTSTTGATPVAPGRGSPRAVEDPGTSTTGATPVAPGRGSPRAVEDPGTSTTGATPVAPGRGSPRAVEDPGTSTTGVTPVAPGRGSPRAVGRPGAAAQTSAPTLASEGRPARRLQNLLAEGPVGAEGDPGTSSVYEEEDTDPLTPAITPAPAASGSPGSGTGNETETGVTVAPQVFEEDDQPAPMPEDAVSSAEGPLASMSGTAENQLAPVSAAAEPLSEDPFASAPLKAEDAPMQDMAPADDLQPAGRGILPPIWIPPCPIAEVQAGNVTFRSDSLTAGTHEFTFLAVATSPGEQRRAKTSYCTSDALFACVRCCSSQMLKICTVYEEMC
jgi:hypothetical protein